MVSKLAKPRAAKPHGTSKDLIANWTSLGLALPRSSAIQTAPQTDRGIAALVACI